MRSRLKKDYTTPWDLPFGIWLSIASATSVAVGLALRSGALTYIIQNDTTSISAVILLLLLAQLAWAGRRAWQLSRENFALNQAVIRLTTQLPNPFEHRLASACVRALERLQTSQTPHIAPALTREEVRLILIEELHGPHTFGWFMSETITKLGLLGTVLGFMIMLSALVGSTQLELSAMQNILRDMAAGMGIKIIATVVGIMANLILSLQFIVLDRSSDHLIAKTIQASLHPKLETTQG